MFPRPTRLFLTPERQLVIDWSDGHDTGIFTIELLRKLGAPTE